MNILNKADINNVSNNYLLKAIFSNIDYHRILKIIKDNNQLKNRLGINLNNYKNLSDMPKYEYIHQEKEYNRRQNLLGTKYFSRAMHVTFCTSCLTILFFLYSLIYTILLVSKDNFVESNSKENYDKSIVETIQKINPYLFIFDGFLLVSCFLYLCYVSICDLLSEIQSIIKFGLAIINILIFLFFFFFVIWKLVLSYKIIKEEIGKPWFIIMDYLFIIFNGIYTIYLIYIIFFYFNIYIIKTITKEKYILKSFNDIEIEDYSLPIEFSKWDKKERKKYIKRNCKNFEYKMNNYIFNLIEKINAFRVKNNLQKFAIEGYNKIPDFIVQPSSIIILFNKQNIFKLSNKKYLLRYPLGEFEELYKNKDKNIINILSKNNLNHIQMITQNKIEYIYISEIPHYIYANNKFSFSEEEKEEKIRLTDDFLDRYKE